MARSPKLLPLGLRIRLASLTWGDVVGFAVAAILSIGLIWFFLNGWWPRLNAGFGPEWECHSPTPGIGPVCIKKRPASTLPPG